MYRVILLAAATFGAASAAAQILVGRAAPAMADICPYDPTNHEVRAELEALPKREKLPAGMMSRGDYARILRVRSAISEQDDAALDRLRTELGPRQTGYPNVLLALAYIRTDAALLQEAAKGFGRVARDLDHAGPAFDHYVASPLRAQAFALLSLAYGDPDQMAQRSAEAVAILRSVRPNPGEAEEVAAELAEALAAPQWARSGPSADWLAAQRRAIAAARDPGRREDLRAELVDLLMDAAERRPQEAAVLLAEAAAEVRTGAADAAVRAGRDQRRLLERVGGDLTGTWRIWVLPDTVCLRRAGWQVRGAMVALAQADNDRAAAEARAELAAAIRRLEALPAWLNGPRPNGALARSWLAAARIAAGPERAAALMKARHALDAADRLASHCFCAEARSRLAALRADPLLN